MEQAKLKDIKRIRMPDGKLFTYYRSEGQSWTEIVLKKILPDWERYCDEHWISANHEDIYAPEKRVKAFLDGCAWLMILDHPEGIESKYKAMVHAAREIPASECPAEISDYFYSDRKPPIEEECERTDTFRETLSEKIKLKPHVSKRRKQTKFDRIERIIKDHPNDKRAWCMVSENNEFVFDGKRYTITRHVGYDDQQMDRVYVVGSARGGIECYDQFAYPIPEKCIAA